MGRNKLGTFFDAWKRHAAQLLLESHALVLAYRDARTPWYARAWALVVAAYAFSPIDLIPDFIPILGILDDLLLVPLGVALALRMIPAAVMAEARERARSEESPGKALRWLAAGAVLLGWAAVLAGAAFLLLRRSRRP